MITLYGQVLNETDDWLVFAPALSLEESPLLGDAVLLGKSQVQLLRNQDFGLDLVRIRGRCRRGSGRPRGTRLFAAPAVHKRQQFLFSP